jgi:hypothetical protein
LAVIIEILLTLAINYMKITSNLNKNVDFISIVINHYFEKVNYIYLCYYAMFIELLNYISYLIIKAIILCAFLV